jgi:hypothetical protein
LVPLELVWANFHGLFAVGLGVCGIYFVAELVRPFAPGGGPVRPARLGRLALVGVLAGAACLVNPNGVDLPLYALTQLGMIGTDRHPGLASVEIQSLVSAWRLLSPIVLAAFAALAAASALAMLGNRHRLRASDALLWLVFLGLAVAGHRNMALFAVAAAPILVRNAAEWLDRRAAAPRLRMAAAVGVAALLCAVAVDARFGRFFERLGMPRAPGFGIVEVMLPIRAVDWIEAHRPPGPIAHHMSDGGYLIWRLFPDYPVMIDGRLEVYGGERNLALRIPGPDRFRELDRIYHFGTVIVRFNEYRQGNLLGALWEDPAWKLVFTDDVAAVFVRADAAGSFPAVSPGAPELFEPLGGERESVRTFRLQARVRFYRAVGRPDLAERALREAER